MTTTPFTRAELLGALDKLGAYGGRPGAQLLDGFVGSGYTDVCLAVSTDLPLQRVSAAIIQAAMATPDPVDQVAPMLDAVTMKGNGRQTIYYFRGWTLPDAEG